ncbi:hypothetical protein BCR34DRAFT_88053 [Clohesyomyces aquaticus]|uniref:Uncharacterized protein n=1 Tax=Clohesyomyces aquaticus TaxID=1231657 RepID=A0A1Y2A3G7_9PLEO|nr:hypothetical protein BCR34DRAFT_88053 [Clohesyomyces aquaticus]
MDKSLYQPDGGAQAPQPQAGFAPPHPRDFPKYDSAPPLDIGSDPPHREARDHSQLNDCIISRLRSCTVWSSERVTSGNDRSDDVLRLFKRPDSLMSIMKQIQNPRTNSMAILASLKMRQYHFLTTAIMRSTHSSRRKVFLLLRFLVETVSATLTRPRSGQRYDNHPLRPSHISVCCTCRSLFVQRVIRLSEYKPAKFFGKLTEPGKLQYIGPF